MIDFIVYPSICIVIIFLFIIQKYVSIKIGMSNFSFGISLFFVILWVIGYGGPSTYILRNYPEKFELFFTNWNIVWSLILITNHKTIYKVMKFTANFQYYVKKIDKPEAKPNDLESKDRNAIYNLIEQNDKESINEFYTANIVSYILVLLTIVYFYL